MQREKGKREITEEIVDQKCLYIISFPAYNELLASAILFHNLSQHKFDVKLHITPYIQKEAFFNLDADTPIMLMGFSNKSLDNLKDYFKYIMLLEHAKPPRREVKRIMGGYSISKAENFCIHAIKLLDKIIGSKNVDTKAYITLLESLAFSELSDREREIIKNIEKTESMESKITVKLFGFEYKPLCQALHDTVRPFIPELTGNIENCMSFIRSIGINNIYIKSTQIPEEALTNLVKSLFTKLKKYSKKERKPSEILGEVFYLSKTNILADIRERASALKYILDVKGPEIVALHCISDYYLGLMVKIFEKLPPLLAEAYKNTNEVKYLDFKIIYVHRLKEKPPLTLLYDALADLGLLDESRSIILEKHEELYTIPHYVLRNIIVDYDVFLTKNKPLKEIIQSINNYSLSLSGDSDLMKLIKNIKSWEMK